MARGYLAAILLIVVIALSAGRHVLPGRPSDSESAVETSESSFGDEALRWQRLILQDERGEIAPDAHFRALEARRELLESTRADAREDAGISPASWEWLGPKNYSGRIRSIVIHPARTNELLAGAASGGIWKSTDGGAQWRPTNDFLPSMSIRTLVIDPANAERVYAGTGEVLLGVGVLRSADFGETWQHVPGTQAVGNVYRLAFAPGGAALYAATGTGIYRIYDNAPPLKLYSGLVLDLEASPANAALLIATVLGAGQAFVVRSVNGGQSWTPAAGFPAAGHNDRLEVAFAPSNPAIVYGLSGEGQGRLYRSLDGGATFSLVFSGPTQISGGYSSYLVTGQALHNLTLWVNPFDAASVMAGGISLWKSTNGGQSWIHQGCPYCFQYVPATGKYTNRASGGPVDFHQVVSHPNFDNATNRTVFVVFDQGVMRVGDIALPDVIVLNPTLGTMQFYAGFADASSGRIIGGGQDTGNHLLLPDAAGISEVVTAGDGGPGAIDPRSPDVLYTTTQWLGLSRKTATDYAPLTRCSEPLFRMHDACDQTAHFIAPFVMDLRAPDRLYVGGIRLFRTENAREAVSPSTGPTWRDLAVPGGTGSNYISAIAVAPSDSNIVWVGRSNGQIYMTASATAAQPQWSRVDKVPLPAGRYLTRITVAPHNPALVYVTYGSYSSGNVWTTANGGGTWQNASGQGAWTLPAVPVRDLEIHPSPTGTHWIYAATEVGLFTSENGGAGWRVPQDGPAGVRIDDLFWLNNELILATHGRGWWRAPVGTPTPLVMGAPTDFALAALNGNQVSLSWNMPLNSLRPSSFFLEGGLSPGSVLGSIPIVAPASSFSLALPSGAFYLRLHAMFGATKSAASNEIQVLVNVPAPPLAPTMLVGQANGSTLQLTWRNATTGPAATGVRLDVTGALTTSVSLPRVESFSHSGVPAGTYTFAVRAFNASGTSLPSNPVTLTFTPGCVVPNPPTGFSLSKSGSVVSASWSTPAGGAPVTGYTLLVTGSFVGNIPTTGLSLSGSVSPGTYTARVVATNACGSSAATAAQTVVVP